MAINVSVQYNGGLLPDIILWNLSHRKGSLLLGSPTEHYLYVIHWNWNSNWIIGTGWNWNSGNNRVRCSPDWSVYRCIERYCMTPRQRDDDNNLSVGNRNHLKLGIEPESWLQSHELGF